MPVGNRKTDRLLNALIQKGINLYYESRLLEAKAVLEDFYKLVAVAYNLILPQVLYAGSKLINILIPLEEYEDAERYARICYECLTRPVETESIDVADAALSLAQIKIHHLMKPTMLRFVILLKLRCWQENLFGFIKQVLKFTIYHEH